MKTATHVTFTHITLTTVLVITIFTGPGRNRTRAITMTKSDMDSNMKDTGMTTNTTKGSMRKLSVAASMEAKQSTGIWPVHKARKVVRRAKAVAIRLFFRRPSHNQAAGRRVTIEGAGGTGGSVRCVVHEIGSDDFVVQPLAESRTDGTFSGSAALESRTGKAACGKVFEIRAFENTLEELSTGEALDGWPSAEAASITVQVKRDCGLE
jgi:hypothetical protein